MNEFVETDSGHDSTANNSQENSNDPGKMFIGGKCDIIVASFDRFFQRSFVFQDSAGKPQLVGKSNLTGNA